MRPYDPETRGYTEELWEMTVSCWEQEPNKRLDVSDILEVLKTAARQWKPRIETDSHTLLEPEDTSNSPPYSPVIKTLVPATATSTFTSPSPVHPPSTTNDETPPAYIPVTLSEEKTPSTFKGLSWEEDYRQILNSFPQDLVAFCEEYGILPRWCMTYESKVKKLGKSPVSSGGFSCVWRGKYGEEGETVAIKILRPQASKVQRIKQDLCREAVTWKRLSHKNILPFIGAMINDKEYALVSPWMERGTIVEFLKHNCSNPLELLHGAACGLQYLHSMDLVHGDLKGANILVSDDGRACLTDFGLTMFAGNTNSAAAAARTSIGAGTIRWCPPELLFPNGHESTAGRLRKKSDIYSMAMTIYEVLTDAPPFHEYKKPAIVLNIVEGRRPQKPAFSNTRGYTQELWDMTTLCWKREPTERPSVDRVLESLKTAAMIWELERVQWVMRVIQRSQ